jgi:hypothetical protein
LSTLTSASTDAQVRAAYDNNASYEEDGSVAKAKAFITACRILVHRLPKRIQKSQDIVDLTVTEVQAELKAARQFVASSASSGGGFRHFNVEDYR